MELEHRGGDHCTEDDVGGVEDGEKGAAFYGAYVGEKEHEEDAEGGSEEGERGVAAELCEDVSGFFFHGHSLRISCVFGLITGYFSTDATQLQVNSAGVRQKLF